MSKEYFSVKLVCTLGVVLVTYHLSTSVTIYNTENVYDIV